jgi:hypothetical protein
MVFALVFLVGCAGTPTATPAGRASPTVLATASATVRAASSAAGVAASPTFTSAPRATPATPTVRPASPAVPPATPTLTPSGPTATATPGRVAVAVENVGNYRNAFGVLYFIGEFVNTGDLEVAGLQIAVSLIGDDGQPVASGQANAIGVNVLPVGQRTVWAAPLANAPAQWKEERIQPQAVAATAETRAPHAVGLSAEGATVTSPTDPALGIAVSGQVRNGGTSAARFPLVTVGCYDAAGKLIMVDTGPAQQQEIAPGATAPFRVTVPNLKDPPARVVAYAKASAVR